MPESAISTAVVESGAIRNLYSLVNGGLYYQDQLIIAERCIRTIVLHDVSTAVSVPFPFFAPFPEDLSWISREDHDLRITEELRHDRLIDHALTDDLGLFEDYPSEIEFDEDLTKLALWLANSKTTISPFYEAHRDYLGRVITTMRHGGSALLISDLGENFQERLERLPTGLFDQLDAEWKRFASQASNERFGLVIPPVLGVVLTRCARREAIPTIIRDLRDEWAVPRQKVWDLLRNLRAAPTIGAASEIRRELSEASKLFSPGPSELSSRPLRVLWDLAASTVAGVAIAAFSAGKPIVGAITGAITSTARSASTVLEFGPALFGRGAFDLARRVARETSKVEFDALARLISDEEREDLGCR